MWHPLNGVESRSHENYKRKPRNPAKCTVNRFSLLAFTVTDTIVSQLNYKIIKREGSPRGCSRTVSKCFKWSKLPKLDNLSHTDYSGMSAFLT